jgi:hypothetical protein
MGRGLSDPAPDRLGPDRAGGRRGYEVGGLNPSRVGDLRHGPSQRGGFEACRPFWSVDPANES